METPGRSSPYWISMGVTLPLRCSLHDMQPNGFGLPPSAGGLALIGHIARQIGPAGRFWRPPWYPRTFRYRSLTVSDGQAPPAEPPRAGQRYCPRPRAVVYGPSPDVRDRRGVDIRRLARGMSFPGAVEGLDEYGVMSARGTARTRQSVREVAGDRAGTYSIRINDQWRIHAADREQPCSGREDRGLPLRRQAMAVKVSVAIHPGEHIAEELEERSMSAASHPTSLVGSAHAARHEEKGSTPGGCYGGPSATRPVPIRVDSRAM